MGIVYDTKWERVKECLKLVDQVNFSYDLERLKRMDITKRTELWNNIIANQQKFEDGICGEMERDLIEDISGRFSLAKLLLATAAFENKEDSPIIREFNDTELNLIKELEKFAQFEHRSIEDSVGSIYRHQEGFYELITDYYEKGYSNLDNIWKNQSILMDLRRAINNRYGKIQKRIKEITIACIDKYGLSWVKSSILVKVKDSEQKRGEIFRDAEAKIEKLEIDLKKYESIGTENQSLKDKLSQLDAELFRKEIKNDEAQKILSSLEADKNRLEQKYAEMGGLLDSQMRGIDEKRGELDRKIAELEKEREQYKEKMQEENQRIVENELKEIARLKDDLQNKENTLLAEKYQVDLKKNEVSEKLNQITDVMQGKSVRFVTREDAKLYELNFIARFETKLHYFPVKIYNPLENKNYTINSWEDHYRFDSKEEIFSGDNTNYAEVEAKNPLNVRLIYLVEEKRFKLFGEKQKKMAIEAISFNHLKEYANYGFDTNRATLSEFLTALSNSIKSAEMGKYYHVVGIASPTGWDERVIEHLNSKEFASRYVSKNVSVCIIDSVTGDVFYNSMDNGITGLIDLFRQEFDREKVERVKKHVLEKLKLKDYVVLGDVVEETKEARSIVNKAFYDLEKDGKCRTRYIRNVGLVIEAQI
ncbi:MAG: hypothetical protein KKA10_13325 [Euryarchaeota archaeon]|nr:hypothetical protein [Euryarchaeota archaeon]MCG2738495.1 hypothetical protein [Candidatus Methanoperedenaceae archaeon]